MQRKCELAHNWGSFFTKLRRASISARCNPGLTVRAHPRRDLLVVACAYRRAVADLNPAAVFRKGGPDDCHRLAGERMTKAIEGIVDAYVKLGDRRALEDLRMHRRRLAVDLKGRSSGSYDFSLPLGQIDEEIAAIEAGLERLNTAHSP